MSGGHFNDYKYIYFDVYHFADELETELKNNFNKDEYGYAPQLNKEVVKYLESKVKEIRKMSEIMKAIDYLYSGDHGEESFLEKIKSIEEQYDP